VCVYKILPWGFRITEGQYSRITERERERERSFIDNQEVTDGELLRFACRIEQGDGSGSTRFSWASTAESSARSGSRFRGGARLENTHMRARTLLPDVEDFELGLC
jgi:hypothetical protein